VESEEIDKKISNIIEVSITCVEASRRNAEIANLVNKRMTSALIIMVVCLSSVIAFDKYLDYKSVYVPTFEQEIKQNGIITTQKQIGDD
jgi:hypothetical protein